jgi:hypothetical protein
VPPALIRTKYGNPATKLGIQQQLNSSKIGLQQQLHSSKINLPAIARISKISLQQQLQSSKINLPAIAMISKISLQQQLNSTVHAIQRQQVYTDLTNHFPALQLKSY